MKDLRTGLSFDERQLISALTNEEIQKIDATLISFVIERPRKVAFICMSAMRELGEAFPKIGDLFYIERVIRMIEDGQFEHNGRLDDWRRCEVWLSLR